MTKRLHHRSARIGWAFAFALSLGACSADTTSWSPAASPKANKVELVHLTFDVPFAGSEHDLDGEGKAGLEAFLARNEVGYGDRVYVIAAARQTHAVAARRAEGIARVLALHGLAPSVLAHAEWAGRPPRADAVRVLVQRFVVRAPGCPDFRKPASGDYGNTESSNFGCATAVNLGLMVADPRDLVQGRDDGPADGERAAASIRRYREGKETPIDTSGTGASPK